MPDKRTKTVLFMVAILRELKRKGNEGFERIASNLESISLDIPMLICKKFLAANVLPSK